MTATSINNQIGSLKNIAEELGGLGMTPQATILLEAAETIDQQRNLLDQLHNLIATVQDDMDAIQPLFIEAQGSDHHDHHTAHQQ